MAGVSDIINLALGDIGVIGDGQTPDGGDSQIAFMTLNQMLAQWRTSNLEVYCQKKLVVPMNGALTYTIGPGGNLSVDRPTDITSAQWRNGTLDADLLYSLRVLPTLTDWQELTTQALSAWPSAVLYEPTFPLGTIYVWPQPASGQLELIVRQPMPVYISIGDDIQLPPEYEAAVRFNLAVWCGGVFSTPVRPDISKLASRTLRALKRSNTRVRNLQMPAGTPSGQGIGRLNIIDNQYSR